MPPVSGIAKFDFLDVGGSLNDGQPPSAIANNEWQHLLNFYQEGIRLRRRGGTTRETETQAGENLTGLHVLNRVDGSRYLMVGGITRIFRQDGTALVAVAKLEGGLHNPTLLPWVTLQYNDIVYWLRRDNGGLRRGSYDYVQNAGLLPPATAPTIADGGAGIMTAGNLQVVYTGYNTNTTMESNPSPASNVLALGASRQVAVSGIAVHPNPQVTARRVYITVQNQTGRYFFGVQINDNSTTTVNINLAIDGLGRAVSFRNGIPPVALELGDIWKERLFASDGIDQFYSETGMMEAFNPVSIIPVFRNDGHRISANHGFGDRLIIGKTNKVHYLLGTDPSDFSLHTLSDKHGCWSHHSMKSAEGNLFWYGGDNVYRSDGATAYSISTFKIKRLLESIPASRREFTVGFVYPPKFWYGLSFSRDTSGQNIEVLIYNYKTDVWARFAYNFVPGVGSVGPAFVISDFDASDEPTLYAAFYDQRVHQLESGLVDDDNKTINCLAISKDHDFGAVGLTKFLYRLFLLTSRMSAAPMILPTIGVYLNGTAGGQIKSRNVSLAESAPWKRVNMSTLGRPAYTLALFALFDGREDLQLEGYSMEVLVQPRAKQPL